MLNLFKKTENKKCITFNMKPIKGAYGGGFQFLRTFINYLENANYKVNFKLGKHTDCIFIMNVTGRISLRGHVTFGLKEVINFNKARPDVKCILRINSTDKHRTSNHIDKLFEEMSIYADHIIFISKWEYNYYSDLWFDQKNSPYSIINNVADEKIFYLNKEFKWNKHSVIKFVTHHFSNNMNKGFNLYRELDELIYKKEIKNCEFYLIGNFPKEINWKSAKIFPLLKNKDVGNILRSCNVYITGSQYEASGMHWIEAIQCGLPILYSKNGGAIAEDGKDFGVPCDENLKAAIKSIKENYDEYYSNVVRTNFSSKNMCTQYEKVIGSLISSNF